MLENDKAIEDAHRRLLAAVVVRAVEDLALVRAGHLLKTVQPGNVLFDKVLYPHRYFKLVLGYTVKDDPLDELIDFFNSEYFADISKVLESTLGFKLTGEQVLKKKTLPRIFFGMKNVRGQRKKRTTKKL